MAEETTTAAVQYALHRQVWSALKAAYAGETDDVSTMRRRRYWALAPP